MKGTWLLVAALCPALVFSQGNFKVITSAGVIAGQSPPKPSFQLVPGLSFGQWFTGLGIGLDYYNLTSFPLFASGRMNFGKRESGFLYTDVGYNFPGSYKKEEEFLKISDKFSGGLYLDAGIGYRVPFGKMHHLSLSAGYSIKSVIQKKVFVYPCGIVGPCFESSDTYVYKYNFNRVVTKLSWEFGKKQ